jgi:hypothetical protein
MSDRTKSDPLSNFALDSMSTTELENLLRMDAHTQSTGTSDSSLILRVLEILEKREQKDDINDCPNIDTAWNRFSQIICQQPEMEHHFMKMT